MNKIVMSINPEHVNNIINGTKKYEYRTKAAKKDINRLIIYETSFFCTSGIVFFLIALSVVESSPVPRTGDRASGLREASLL